MNIDTTRSESMRDSSHSNIANTRLPMFGEDWKTVTVGKFAPLCYGKELQKDIRNSAGQIPVLGSNGIIDWHDKGLTDGPTIIIGRKGTAGSVHYSSTPCWPIDTTFFISGSDAELVKFQYYALTALNLEAMIIDSAVPGLNRIAAHARQLRVPPLPEQRAIAEALSDMDGLLEALEALIAKKWNIKQAAMQQLLTGKTRLPGFRGPWTEKRLSDLGSFSKGHGIKREDVSIDGLPCIRYGELYTYYREYTSNLLSRIPSAIAKGSLPIKKSDILFAGSGETAEEIGRCTAYMGGEQAFAGGDIIVFTPFAGNSIFFGYLMNHPVVAKQKSRLAQGDAVVHISAVNLARMKISLPSVDEQHAIAAVLSDMDAEIAALERRLDKTRAVKQGMMQQLLTGKVRLVKPKTAAKGNKKP